MFQSQPGTLIAKPLTAKLCHDTDAFARMDPYVVLKMGAQQKWTSSVCQRGGKTPSWNQQTTFRRSNEDIVDIEVWDYDTASKNDLVGQGAFALAKIMNGGKSNDWINLTYKGKQAGQILIEFEYIPDGNKMPQQMPQQMPQYQQPMMQPQYQQPMQPQYQQPMMQPQFQQPMMQPQYQQPMMQPQFQQPMMQPQFQQPYQQYPPQQNPFYK